MDSILFDMEDPGIEFGIAVAEREKPNSLRLTMTTALLPPEVAVSVAEGLTENTAGGYEEPSDTGNGLFGRLRRKGRH